MQASGNFPRSPWHSSLALSLDGSYTTVHAKDVRDTHNLIHKYGRPYYYRERSDLWDWEDEEVVFDPVYPNTLLVYPMANLGREKALAVAQVEKLKELRAVHKGPVEVIGFENAAPVDGQ